jgi:hypothetical protein
MDTAKDAQMTLPITTLFTLPRIVLWAGLLVALARLTVGL